MQQEYRLAIRQLAPAITITILILLFSLSSSLVELVYAEHIYQYIAVPLRLVSSYSPFPLGDILYLLLIVYVLWRLALLIGKAVRKKLVKDDRLLVPLAVIKFLLYLYIAFKMLWGLNYSRPPINTRLGIADERYTNKELLSLARYLINNINRIQEQRRNDPQITNKVYSLQQLKNEAFATYTKLAGRNPFFNYPVPVVKQVLNSWMITKLGLEGYYSPVSGEANVNMNIPAPNRPFVICHEIAHQLGVAREDEANLVGYLAASNSDDLNFQYSANYAVLKNVLFELRMKVPEGYEGLMKTLNQGTINDFKNDRKFWMSYNSDMYLYMDMAFDRFLKFNNQSKGTDSYQDIVIWLYNLHKNRLR